MKKFWILAIVIFAVFLSGCDGVTLIKGNQVNGVPNPDTTLGWSENGAYTADERFFIVGGKAPYGMGSSAIFEIKKNDDGSYENITVIEEAGCAFAGLTSRGMNLYAACTSMRIEDIPGVGPMEVPSGSTLYRVDMSKDPVDSGSVVTASIPSPYFFSNGMCFDDQGNLYISNSLSVIFASFGLPCKTSILKINITDNGDSMSIEKTDWKDIDGIGYSPNGIRIMKNNLYLASGNLLFKIPINEDGTAGMQSAIYTADRANLLDDLDIAPGLIAVAELTSIVPDITQRLYPDVVFPEEPIARITYVNMKTGTKIGETDFSGTATPSSIVFSRGCLFTPFSAVVTDAIDAGGLYLVK